MKKKDRILVVFLVVLIGLYVARDINKPKKVNWSTTYVNTDKNPFGTYILCERSSDFMKEGLSLSRKTISELEEEKNLLLLANRVPLGEADVDALFQKISDGGTVFIGSETVPFLLLDSLNHIFKNEELITTSVYSPLKKNLFEQERDTLLLLSDSSKYLFPKSLTKRFFKVDADSLVNYKINMVSNNKLITQVEAQIGKGKLILSLNPKLFTNFGMLYDSSYSLVPKLLTSFSGKKTHYTMYYQTGRNEARTPFRYILRQPPLRWALYITLLLVVLFLVVSSRRKQRAIPIVAPPENTTVKYVKTLGKLYYEEGDNQGILQKQIQYFYGQIKIKHHLTPSYENNFHQKLADRTGVEKRKIKELFESIQDVKNGKSIQNNQLIEITKQIEELI